MFNRDFLKKLTILFIEDDNLARTQLEKILKRLFKEVVVAKNGLEGYQTYQERRINDKSVDLILSDINMPQMNGIEMLEKIREHDADTPIIFSTARSETEYLLKAISLQVEHYALKPIDLEDIVSRIEKVCEKQYYEKLIHEKTVELQEYLKIINNVATIFKMDDKGNIIFANTLFLDSTNYKKEEILEKNFNDIISDDIDKNLISSLWKTIQNNETWKADLKYKNKNNEIFYIKSTIFKISNENKNEYISIGFISTTEVNDKREFHKKLINNIKDNNIKVAKSEQDIKYYEVVLNKLNNDLSQEKQKQVDLRNQVSYYENELLNVDKRILKNLKIKNHEIEDLKNTISRLKNEKDFNYSSMSRLSEELINSKVEIEKLYEKLKLKEKRIDDLNDLVEIRESQLKKYDSTFENL